MLFTVSERERERERERESSAPHYSSLFWLSYISTFLLSTQMAKKIVLVKPWIEVFPSPLIFPQKPSVNSPKLETIREEREEESQ